MCVIVNTHALNVAFFILFIALLLVCGCWPPLRVAAAAVGDGL